MKNINQLFVIIFLCIIIIVQSCGGGSKEGSKQNKQDSTGKNDSVVKKDSLNPDQTYQNNDKAKQDSIAQIRAKEKRGEIIWTNNYFGYFYDVRDNRRYNVIKMGKQAIMTQNLAFKPETGNYWAYNDNPAKLSEYGYLYDGNTAKIVVPKGWHLPSKEELNAIYRNYGDDKTKVYNALKEGGTSGFQAKFSGYRNALGAFVGENSEVYFWTSTIDNSGFTWRLYLNSDKKTAKMGISSAVSGFSVRLIKD